MAKRKFKNSVEIKTTLEEAFELFVEEKEAGNLSNATLKNYKQSFNIFCDYHELMIRLY